MYILFDSKFNSASGFKRERLWFQNFHTETSLGVFVALSKDLHWLIWLNFVILHERHSSVVARQRSHKKESLDLQWHKFACKTVCVCLCVSILWENIANLTLSLWFYFVNFVFVMLSDTDRLARPSTLFQLQLGERQDPPQIGQRPVKLVRSWLWKHIAND